MNHAHHPPKAPRRRQARRLQDVLRLLRSVLLPLLSEEELGRETTELANAIVQEASKERPRYERDGGRAVVAIDPEAEYVHVTTME
jgi:hypothetical protein